MPQYRVASVIRAVRTNLSLIMARLPRLAIAGRTHLVLQRTLPSQSAFIDDDDRRAFLAALRQQAGAQRVAVHGWGLFDHEVRLLATPAQAESLSRLVQAVGRAYVAGFNRRHARRGTLWDGRYRATVLDEETVLIDALRWVETPPDADGGSPLDHAWSSARHHLGQLPSPLVSEHPRYWRLGNTPFEREAAYRRLLEQPLSAARVREIEAAVLKGWALGPPSFVQELLGQTTRRLQPLGRGRPRKSALTAP